MTDSEEAERTWSRESFCILEGSGPDSLFIELKIIFSIFKISW